MVAAVPGPLAERSAAAAGTLARDILAAGPGCSAALRYVLVDRSAALRAAQSQLLPIAEPELVLGPTHPRADPDDGRAARK